MGSRLNRRPSAAHLTAGGDAESHQHAETAASSARTPSIRAGGDNFRLRARGMASVLCSPCHHHHRSYICRRLRSSPSSHARPRSGAGGPSVLNTTKFLHSHPMSTGRGSPALRSSMEPSNSNQGPEHLIVLVHGIMASSSDWTYGDAVLKKRLGDDFFMYDLQVHFVADGLHIRCRGRCRHKLKMKKKSNRRYSVPLFKLKAAAYPHQLLSECASRSVLDTRDETTSSLPGPDPQYLLYQNTASFLGLWLSAATTVVSSQSATATATAPKGSICSAEGIAHWRWRVVVQCSGCSSSASALD